MKKLLIFLAVTALFGCTKPPKKPLIVIEVYAIGYSVEYKLIDANGNKYSEKIPFENNMKLLSVGDTLK